MEDTKTEEFAMRLEPALWARKKLGMELDATQTMIVNSRAHRLMLNCHRQWGKSTVTALMALHRALYWPGVDVVCVSRTLEQAAEWLRKARTMAERLGLDPGTDGSHRHSMEFENGSRIIALAGRPESNRGYSKLALLIFEEASQVPPKMYAAMRPMLAVSNGDLFIISTPWGQEGFFFDEWMRERPGWTKVMVKATESGRIPAEFLEEERLSLGEVAFRQEYLCEFLEGEDALLARDVIERAFTKEVTPLRLG